MIEEDRQKVMQQIAVLFDSIVELRCNFATHEEEWRLLNGMLAAIRIMAETIQQIGVQES